MIRKNYIVSFIFFFVSLSMADGLLIADTEDYPKDFLKNKLTHVTVNVNGVVAETRVYQEFVNEWHNSVDAVYSFPLPPNARATEFVYWHNDTVYKAILKVKEQAVNPGTGEGGIVAEVNKYIGRNGIRIKLKDIAANSIQKVRLHYISLMDYYAGESTYSFPLAAKDFITYPLDHVQFSFNVNSNSPITDYDIPGQSNILVKENSGNQLNIDLKMPKSYLDKDIQFSYKVNHEQLGVDFYSINNDSSAGHFALFVRPENEAAPDSILPKQIIFLLSNSNTMSGFKLDQSKSAITDALDKLSPDDFFNIVVYNYSVTKWMNKPIIASEANIQLAKDYLASTPTASGSRLDLGISECLNQIQDESLVNSIVVLSDGRSPLDPEAIETQNSHKTAIFPIGIGDNIDRAKLEMTAALNYGFVTYVGETDNIHEKIVQLFNKINQPLLKDTQMEFGNAGLSYLIPEKLPSTYAGSYLFVAGRYDNPGESAFSIAGTNPSGFSAYNFRLDYSEQENGNKFVEFLWAKEMIDDLERRIEIYGETDEMKEQLIALSLKYNIRCRYTAYIADYETIYVTPIIDNQSVFLPKSFIKGNFPNPFNPQTTIRLFIDQNSLGKTKLLKIYNILGQLIAVIDISNLTAGWHDVLFNGKDMFGNSLPSGTYFVRLQIQNKLSGTLKMNLIQ